MAQKVAKVEKTVLRIPTNRGIASLEVSKNELAVQNERFMTALSEMILSARPSGEWRGRVERDMMLMRLKKHSVTCVEAYEAFMAAYEDEFTPKTGVEWRHIWKYVKQTRHGSGDKLYTYDEMIAYCDKHNLSTDHFERDGEIAESATGDVRSVRCWRLL